MPKIPGTIANAMLSVLPCQGRRYNSGKHGHDDGGDQQERAIDEPQDRKQMNVLGDPHPRRARHARPGCALAAAPANRLIRGDGRTASVAEHACLLRSAGSLTPNRAKA
jgi:hypothetical protein